MAKKSEEKELTIEEAFSAVDEKIKELEKSDVSLEDSFKLFKESMEKTLAMRYPYVKALETLQIDALPQGDIPVLGASQLTN